MLRFLVAALFVSSLSLASPPRVIKHPVFTANTISMSPDGRIAVTVHADNFERAVRVRIARPETITFDSKGAPIFSEDFFSTGILLNSQPIEIEYVAGVNDRGVPHEYRNEPHSSALAIHPSLREQRYLSDSNGNPDPNGAFHTYKLILVEGNPAMMRLQSRELTVIVKNPESKSAEVYRALASEVKPLTTPDQLPLIGFEPTLTADGRVLIFHGFARDGDIKQSVADHATVLDCWTNSGDSDPSIRPGSTSTQAEKCSPAANGNANTYLFYSINETPENPNTWSLPKDLTQAYFERDKPFMSGKLKDYFPLASSRLLEMDGTPVAAPYSGAYPWITPDGTELLHTTIRGGALGNVAVRSGTSIIGQWTGFRLRYIDGPNNPSRWNRDGSTVRAFYSSPGISPSMWPPFGSGVRGLPYTNKQSVLYLIGASSRDYAEVSFDEFNNGSYIAYLPMGEGLKKIFRTNGNPASRWRIDTSFTPDIGGNGNNGILEGGARFPYEFSSGLSTIEFLENAPTNVNPSHDVNSGINGQAIYFPSNGAVRVRANSSFQRIQNSFGFEAFIKPTASMSGKMGLASLPGVFSIQISGFNLNVLSGEDSSCSTSATLNLEENQWSHVIVDGTKTRLRIFINGDLKSTAECSGINFSANGDLLVGPGSGGVVGSPPVILLDEIGLKSSIYEAVEVKRRSFNLNENLIPAYASSSVVPSSLNDSIIQNPEEAIFRKDISDIGKKIFEDHRLSADGRVSCSSCHLKELAFTDGRKVARGVFNREGKRNTPTILNRFLGSSQNLDGSAESIHEQAKIPISHPAELGLSLAEFVHKTSSLYGSQLRAVGFDQINKDVILESLAQYVRGTTSQNSRFDKFINGDKSAISDSARRGFELFRGKARCIACHAGPNFTDESFHVTGLLTNSNDKGRFEVTGLAKDIGAFKTPTLRDVDLTAPYFHDGSVATLDEVLALYNRGSVVSNASREIRPLDLSSTELSDLKEFLLTLRSGASREVSDSAAIIHLESKLNRASYGAGEGIFLTARYLQTVGESIPVRLVPLDTDLFEGQVSSEQGNNREIIFRGWLKAPATPGEYVLKLVPVNESGAIIGDATPGMKVKVTLSSVQQLSCVQSSLFELVSRRDLSQAEEKLLREDLPTKIVNASNVDEINSIRRGAVKLEVSNPDFMKPIVALSYSMILGRSATPNDLINVPPLFIQTGIKNRLIGLFRSKESMDKMISGYPLSELAWRVFADRAYRVFLNRAPTADEISEFGAIWSSELTHPSILLSEVKSWVDAGLWNSDRPQFRRLGTLLARILEKEEAIKRFELSFRQILSNRTGKSYSPATNLTQIRLRGFEAIFEELLLQTPVNCAKPIIPPVLEDPTPAPLRTPQASISLGKCSKKGKCSLQVSVSGQTGVRAITLKVHKRGKPGYVRIKLSSTGGVLTGSLKLSLKRVKSLELRQGKLMRHVAVKRATNKRFYLEDIS